MDSNLAEESGSAPVDSQDINISEPETLEKKEEYMVPYKVLKEEKNTRKQAQRDLQEMQAKIGQLEDVQKFLAEPEKYPEIIQKVTSIVDFYRGNQQSNLANPQQSQEELEDFVTKKDLHNMYSAVQQMMGFQHQAMTIQQKYKDVDVNALYRIAAEKRLPDLDTAYQVWKAQNLDSFTKEIKESAIKDYLAKQTENLPSGGTGGSSTSKNLPSLSEEEKKAATKMGLSFERYAEWKKKLNLS